jgi:ParB/RepB/Spo0J family partition protein
MELKKISINEIVVPNNSRKLFIPEAIQELAASIKSVGLIQPIGIIPDGKKYRLLYGERRLRACVVNKMKTIDAKVFENLTEHEETIIHLTENIQRRDLTAYEEMQALLELKDRGFTIEELSDRIGRSLKYVYDRINLSLLIPEFVNKLQDGILQVSHAKELIRLTPTDQKELFEMWGDGFSLNELRELIKKHFNLKLANAPFMVNDESLLLGAGACTDCTKRSGSTNRLFEGYEASDICFDKNCYQSKVVNHIESLKKSWEGLGVEVIKVSDRWLSEKDRQEKGVRLLSEFIQIPKEAVKNHTRQSIALIVDSFGKVGRYVDILSDDQRNEYNKEVKLLQGEKQIEKQNPDAKPLKEAKIKFVNDLLGNVVREVTINEFNGIPRGFRIANVISLFLALPLSDRIEIAEARNWMTAPNYTTIDEDQLNDRIACINTVYHNIKNAGDKTIKELEFTLQAFMLKGLQVNSESFEIVTSIAGDFAIDTAKLLNEINEQFGVNLEIDLF